MKTYDISMELTVVDRIPEARCSKVYVDGTELILDDSLLEFLLYYASKKKPSGE